MLTFCAYAGFRTWYSKNSVLYKPEIGQLIIFNWMVIGLWFQRKKMKLAQKIQEANDFLSYNSLGKLLAYQSSSDCHCNIHQIPRHQHPSHWTSNLSISKNFSMIPLTLCLWHLYLSFKVLIWFGQTDWADMFLIDKVQLCDNDSHVIVDSSGIVVWMKKNFFCIWLLNHQIGKLP